TMARARRPAPCTDEGLPSVRSASAMASNACCRSGLVALWSRYATDIGTRPLACGRHAVRFRGRRRFAEPRRELALQHVVQRHRSEESVDLIAELLPQIMGQAFAAIGAAAGGAHFGAARRLDGLVDRENDLRHARLGRAARQTIAAARTAHALDQTGAAQAGE